jgi:hypothetical protein
MSFERPGCCAGIAIIAAGRQLSAKRLGMRRSRQQQAEAKGKNAANKNTMIHGCFRFTMART